MTAAPRVACLAFAVLLPALPLAQAVTADRDAADLAGKLYVQGLTDFLTVLDAERQLNQAENALAQSDTQIDTALIALYKALGGGWESAEQNTQPDATHATTAKAAEMPDAK